MEKGKIVEQGKHKELLSDRKVYTVTYISYSQTNRKNREYENMVNGVQRVPVAL